MAQAFKSGLGGYDWRTEREDIKPYKDAENFRYDADVLRGIKNACHQKLYAFANSSLMNLVDSSVSTQWNMTWWRAAYYAGFAVSGALLLAGAVLYVLTWRKARAAGKEKN